MISISGLHRDIRLTRRAFARLDLCAILSVLGLSALIAFPSIKRSDSDAGRRVCFNNLRRIGQAMLGWSLDHHGSFPWRVPVGHGGTRWQSKPGLAWYEFIWVSNYLATPVILACPSDQRLPKIAKNWSTTEDGGFAHPTFRGNSLSYFIGLDTGPNASGGLLSGDRNLRVDYVNTSCSSGINNASSLSVRPPQAAAWTNAVHGLVGHILFVDGRVELLTTEQLREALPISDDNGSFHLLAPR